MPRWIRIAWVSLIVFSLPAAVVQAQEGSQTYVVAGSQPINARACPMVTCAVVRTFDPGTELAVSAVVQGDTVANSDQWLQVEADGSTVYVHSGLAEWVPPQATPEPPARSVTVDTADWVEHTADGFALDTPPHWVDTDDLLSNEILLEAVARLYEMDPDELVQNVEMTSDTMDLALIDMGNGMTCFVWHEDRGTTRLSPALLEDMLTFQFEQEGNHLISSEAITLPAGNAIRLDMTQKVGFGMVSTEMGRVIYALIIEDQIYYVGFTVPLDFAGEASRETMDRVAASFRMESGS